MNLDKLAWNADGLIPAIAQDFASGEVLMMAWMNREALQITLDEQVAVYYSRSRQALWRKGETSGQTQQIHDIRTDCDRDTILLLVSQTGVACHTGRRSCFYRTLDDQGEHTLTEPLVDPAKLYGAKA